MEPTEQRNTTNRRDAGRRPAVRAGVMLTLVGGMFPRWILNSVFYRVMVAFGATFVAAMTGYSFSKFRFPLRRFWFFLLLGTITVPATALVLRIYLLMHNLHSSIPIGG